MPKSDLVHIADRWRHWLTFFENDEDVYDNQQRLPWLNNKQLFLTQKTLMTMT